MKATTRTKSRAVTIALGIVFLLGSVAVPATAQIEIIPDGIHAECPAPGGNQQPPAPGCDGSESFSTSPSKAAAPLCVRLGAWFQQILDRALALFDARTLG